MSLRTKTILGVALIEAVLLVILISTTLNFMRTSINDNLTKRASTATQLFATTTKDAVLSYDLASLDAFVLEVLSNPDIQYARVIGSDGQVFSEQGNEEALRKSFVADASVEQVNDGLFDAYALIQEGGVIYGRVEIGIGIASIHKAFEQVIRWTSSLAAIEMFLVALFSFGLGTYLTRQLQALVIGAKAIGKAVTDGTIDSVTVQEKGRDELTEVAKSFNQLIANLAKAHQETAEYQDDLHRLNQTLEQRVEQRTRLLAEKNTQLQHTNQELKSTQAQLLQAEKMSSLGQLAAGVAHEINNPVGYVNSNLGSLQDYIAVYEQLSNKLQTYLNSDDEQQRNEQRQSLQAFMQNEDLAFVNEDSTQLISESVEGLTRVKDIVDGLKQFSRADAKEMQFIDVNSCIETTLKMVSNELKYHCNITTDFQSLPKVSVNVGQITQVLTNLLVNAGQAIESDGKINISTHLLKQHIAIAVKDNGKGIEEEHIKHLFDPFFTTKKEGEGTGLGLAISYGIVKEHGGEIRVKSVKGLGTAFTVLLPIAQVSEDSNVQSVQGDAL